MTFRTAAQWAVTILFGTFAGFALAQVVPVVRAIIAPVIERPPQVDALVVKLKTSPLLHELNPDPTSCGHVPKGHPRDRCYYRSGDIQLGIAWSRQSHRILSLWFDKTVPPGSAPFAWAELANTVPMLCGSIDTVQAETIARQIPEELLRQGWHLRGETVGSNVDGATRSTRVEVSKTCVFRLSEYNVRGAVRATIYASPFEAGRAGAVSP